MNELTAIASTVLGVVFVAASIGKMRDPMQFAFEVSGYELVPKSAAIWCGLALIGLESFVGVTHVLGLAVIYGASAGLFLLAILIAGVVMLIQRGRIVPCNCFGTHGDEFVSGRTLARLIMLLALELLVVGATMRDDSAARTFTLMTYPGNRLLLAAWTCLAICIGSWLLTISDVLEAIQPCASCGHH